MGVFRLTQHTYHRLTQSGSLLNQNDGDVRVRYEDDIGTRYENDARRLVTEFDYRQHLHMECGVVALEPPPPYTIAMKELTHRTDRGGHTARAREEGEVDEGFLMGSRGEDQGTSKGSPPPYNQMDGAGVNRSGNEERAGRGNSELILMDSMPRAETQELSNGSNSSQI